MAETPSFSFWRRRLLRFSLGSFLVAITLIAAAFGWIRHRAEQQRLAVEWILSQGGEIRYDHYRQLNTNVYYLAGSDEAKAQAAALRPEDSWFSALLGDHYVYRIEQVYFYQAKLEGEVWRLPYAYGAKQIILQDCDVSAEALTSVGKCRSVEDLTICDSRCDPAGLGHLTQLPKLKNLFLQETPLDDGALEQIGKCRSLESLDLTFCTFPADDVLHLRSLTRLRHCGLGFTSAADRHLTIVSSWPDLEYLEVGQQVTDDGLDHLAGATKLKGIIFMKSDVTDAGIVKLIDHPNLKSVHLSDCKLSDEMIRRLYQEEPFWKVSYVR